MTEKKRVDEILWQIGMLVGAGRTDKLETLITEHLDEVAAAERARIRELVERRRDAALDGFMPFGDAYFNGAKDYCEMILADIDAGEPKEGEG